MGNPANKRQLNEIPYLITSMIYIFIIMPTVVLAYPILTTGTGNILNLFFLMPFQAIILTAVIITVLTNLHIRNHYGNGGYLAFTLLPTFLSAGIAAIPFSYELVFSVTLNGLLLLIHFFLTLTFTLLALTTGNRFFGRNATKSQPIADTQP